MNTACLFVRLQVRPDQTVRVRQELLTLTAPTRTDAGCIGFSVHQSGEHLGRFILCASWINRRAMQEQPWLVELNRLLKNIDSLLLGPVEISLWERIR